MLKTSGKESERPDAVVVLTDGVDTSNDSHALLHDAAVAAGVPVYFVAGTNRSARPDPFLRVREWRVPPTAVRSSEFAIEATFEAFSRADRTVPFSLWQGNRRITRGELALTTGANVIPRNFPVTVSEPGPIQFVLRLGAADDAPVAARAMTQVLEPQKKRLGVLVHQGALDWGFRAFAEALRTDPGFEFVSLFSPEAGVAFARGGPPGSPLLGRIPDTAAPLALLDCVVLAHPNPKRFTTAQQQALVDYVRGGGTVVFASPDAAAMAQFSSGPLREILPVVLDDAVATMVQDADHTLQSFTLTEAGRATPIFVRADGGGGGFLRPRFAEYVPVSRAKAGAEVLAVHPTAIDAVSRQPHILLAIQTLGRGGGDGWRPILFGAGNWMSHRTRIGSRRSGNNCCWRLAVTTNRAVCVFRIRQCRCATVKQSGCTSVQRTSQPCR